MNLYVLLWFLIIYPPLCPCVHSNAMLQGSDGIHVVLNSLQLWWHVVRPGSHAVGVHEAPQI